VDPLLALKMLRTLIRMLVLPPNSLMLLAFAGMCLLRRAPRLGRSLLAIAIAGLWLLSTPAIADRLTSWAEHYPPLQLDQPTGAQAIVILGGGGLREFAPEYGGPEAEPYLLERLAYGAYLSQHTGLPILTTGFRDEGPAMRETLKRNFGIEPRWVDQQSYDTFENARNSARILKAQNIQRVILVTRATHLWRSTQEFEAAGLEVVPAPSGSYSVRNPSLFRYVPDTQAMERSYQAIYELVGDLVRRALKWTHLRQQ
jgi:uncharacterized SAM-binding protein YcdF (DUF218 family)